MRKLLFVFAILLCPMIARAGFVDIDDCDDIPAAQRVTMGTFCLQRTTVSGRTAGVTYVWSGSAWVSDTTVSDGDKGDVVVSGTGGVYAVESIAAGFSFLGDVTPAQITSNQDNYTGCAVATNAVANTLAKRIRVSSGFLVQAARRA